MCRGNVREIYFFFKVGEFSGNSVIYQEKSEIV